MKVCQDPSFSLIRLVGRDAERYFAINRALGDPWIWFSRVRDGAALPALLDHPQLEALVRALNFYWSVGFKPYKMAIEVLDDPRLTGLLPSHSAPHIPIIQ